MGDAKFQLGSTKNYFGEHQKINSGSRGEMVKFQQELGTPPLRNLKEETQEYDVGSFQSICSFFYTINMSTADHQCGREKELLITAA